MKINIKTDYIKYFNTNFIQRNITLIHNIFRLLEDSTEEKNKTSGSDNKKQQLKELYIYIAILAAIIIIILVGYGIYRKCVEKKALNELEMEYQVMIYNLINSMSSANQSGDDSQPKSIDANQIQNIDLGSLSINSENGNYEARMENIRKKYGNKVLIKCLLKKQIQQIDYNKTIEDTYGDKCTICLDGFNFEEKIYKTPCEHIFHINCFDKYLKGIDKKDKLICPNCNQNLLINKKYLKLRARKIDIKKKVKSKDNEMIFNKINRSSNDRLSEFDNDKERAEIIRIKKINNRINKKERKEGGDINININIYNPLKVSKKDSSEIKEDSKNKNKRNILFINNMDNIISSDSKGTLYYNKNTKNPVNKMNSERNNMNSKEISEEEKK